MPAPRSGSSAFRAIAMAMLLCASAGCQSEMNPPPPDGNPTSGSAAPLTPTSVSATATGPLVTLTWAAASGATSYQIKRATSDGGPYAAISTAETPSYVDSNVTVGTTYYYVVAAASAVGVSAHSAQVAATPMAPTPPPSVLGTWVDVTPAGVNLSNALSCGNFGTETVQTDPARPSHMYVHFHCQGLWKSTDYGLTWTGPINTGSNGAAVRDCAGGITIARGATGSAPTIYQSCIRGNGIGFWRSQDGGVNWTRYLVAPTGTARQDYYPPVVDPYDPNHLLMAGHEMNVLVESADGGQTWTSVPLTDIMKQANGTAGIAFINTGNATSTRRTWLWIAQHAGGAQGTWRTSNAGSNWTQVDKNEHPHGSAQLYQPDTNGTVYMAGAYSDRGWGVLMSTDYGQTWSKVGGSAQTVVFGTPRFLYNMTGGPIGLGGVMDPSFQVAAQPGTGTWSLPGTPPALKQGPAQVSVTHDGSHYVFVGAMWASGIWRYVEP